MLPASTPSYVFGDEIMNYAITAFAIGFGVMAFVTMADVSGGSRNIDFKTASLEERQSWMDGKAKSIKTAARFFLPSGRGPMALNMFLKDIVKRPARSEMEMIIDVKVPYGARVGTIPKSKFLKSFCKKYIKLGFYEQGVRLIANFRNKRKKTGIARISVRPNDCQWMA